MATTPASTPASSSPTPTKSSWSWSGRKRRNSESSVSSLSSSLRDFVIGRRNSLSTSDVTTKGNVLRKRPQGLKSHRPDSKGGLQEREPPSSASSNLPDAGPSGAKQDGKTESRPPPAFFNKVKHRHTFSASAILRWYTINSDDEALLKPPPARPRNSSQTSRSPVLKPTAAPPRLRPPRSPLDGPLAMYPTEEKAFVQRTQRASTGMQKMANSQPGPAGPATGHPPPMHMPTAHQDGSFPGGSPDRAGGYNKPRRLSNSSSTSSVTASSVGHDSVDSRVRTASFTSSQTSFDSYSPRTSSVPVTWQNGAGGQNYPWHRPAPIKQRKKAQPGEQFAALPGEILELILTELRKLHLQPGSNSCATCWMRDCCSVAISARKFLKYAREALYQHIQLVGHESPAMKKRTRTAYGSRLVLLRRTLRANAQIAAAVRSLKPPARPMSVGLIAYNDLVASVVMACPNLERLVGYHPTYDHSFQRLFQALSTRPKLKEMNWILEPSTKQQQQRMRPQEARWGPGDLEPQESQLFMGFHADWRQLTTLVVHCQPGAALSPPSMLGHTIRALPALQNLYLSHMPPTAFNDRNLLALPALKKLSLSSCSGVTTAGLSSLATRRTSTTLSALTLLQMNVESLPAIARMLSYLVRLETFTIVQTYAPEMPPDEFMILFPYLASQSLRKLHWDIPYLPNTATPADTILARSISANGFPSLRALCTPNDPEGLFQSLCAPRERVDHPTDRYRGLFPVPGQTGQNTTPWGHTRNSSSFSSTNSGGRAATPTAAAPGNGNSGLSFGRSTPTSMNPFRSRSRTNSRPNTPNGNSNGGANTPTPQSPLFPPLDALIPRENSNLAQARLAAQARLEAAQRIPRYLVHVFDEDQGAMVEKFGIGAFLGHVESRIRYVLSPDAASGATDEGGGVVSVEDMVRDDGGEMVGFFGGGDRGEKSVLGSNNHNSNSNGYNSDREEKKKQKKQQKKSKKREKDWGDGGGVDPESDVEGFLGGTGSRRGSSAGGAGDEMNGEAADTRGEGCTGRWNTYSGMVVDKKDQERWWHQERGRWKGVVLS